MGRWSLSGRLVAVFAALLVVNCCLLVGIQVREARRQQQDIAQRLSASLAGHIATHFNLLTEDGQPNTVDVEQLFHKLMDVNPSVEVYLLDPDGRVLAQAAPAGHLKRTRVDLAPVRQWLAKAPLPILGDDPRSEHGSKVFSAAPLMSGQRVAGYVYVVLLGEDYDALALDASIDAAMKATLITMALAAALCLAIGVAALAWVTRPLHRLIEEINRFDPDDASVLDEELNVPAGAAGVTHSRDEISGLRAAFARMRRRIAEQWRELNSQDQQRRELVANISHDLRTPLTSLHGYLETLRLKSGTLGEDERRRYLDVALSQSRKVSRLAQELFELARLEHGVVKPERERFSLPDLVQDVLQKFELAAEARHQRLQADIAPGPHVVMADLAMIERVLTNLLDNAVRHTPAGGTICIRLRRDPQSGVEVQVSDNGPGIPQALQSSLFNRPAYRLVRRDGSGGLGLVIVRRILQLHGTDIRLVTPAEQGASFRFNLGEAPGHHESLNSA